MSLAWSGGLTAMGFLVAVGKGLVFVLLSTALVFALCRREYRNSARTMGLLRAVVDGTTDAVFVKDREGRYQLVNDAAAKFIGRPVTEILGRDDRELFAAGDAARLMANDRAVMVSGGVITQDETLTSAGLTRTYQATKAPYFDAMGKVIGLIGISRDITDRALVVAALRETDARLREAQRIAKLGSWSWNPQTNQVWWSDAEFELFGLVPGAITPSLDAFLDFLNPDDRQVVIARAASMTEGSDVFANDLRVIRADGTCMWIHSQARATRDAAGKLIIVEGTDQDITSQRLAREAAYESERRLQAAIEVAGLGVIDVDYDQQCAKLSTRAAEQFGISLGATVSREELHSRFHPADGDELAKAIEGALDPAGSGWFALEHRVVRPDGTIRWLNVRKQVMFAEGRPKGAIVVTVDITEQRESQSRLREQEMLVREAAELAKVGGWGFDPITMQSDWTPTVAEMYGVAHNSPPPIASRLDFFSPEHRPALANALAAAIKDGVPHDMELKLIAATGEKKWVRTICRPIVENGKVVRVRGSLQDITDRKRTEAELRASEERYRLLFESNPHPMWVYDVDSLKFLAVNDAAVQAYGYAREEFLAMTIREIRPADEVSRLELDIARKKRGLSRSAEWKHRRKDGTVFDVEISSHDLPEAQGHSRLVLALDITDRKRAEQAREVATQRLSKFASQLPGAIFLYRLRPDHTFCVPYASERIEMLLGLQRELLNSDQLDIFANVHREDYDLVLESIRNSAKELTPIGREFRVVDADGTTRWISCDAVPERESDGSTLWHGYMKEATAEVEREQDLRTARMQADAANRAKSEFLANMSHEIRTPLTAILGFAEVLRGDEKFTAPPHWMHDLDTISSAGKHLLSIINDILDLSKIEADKTTLELIDTHLIDVLSEVERLLRSTASGKGVSLNLRLSTPVPDRVLCDPTRLRQILMNLVGNAVKFTEAGTIVINASVKATTENPSLYIDIEDTGRGIDATYSQSLFQAFEQADNTVSRKHGGTGLGLTISRRLAMLMGGDVTLVRTELGKGSCFRLQLPLLPVAGSVFVDSIETKEVPAGEIPTTKVSIEGRILLAEDGLDNQRLISFLLRKAGAMVDISENGQAALEMLNRSRELGIPYDLLLTDMQMPIMDGYELSRTLRSLGIKMPIVALTAHALAEDRQKCLDAGCDDYLSKPVDKHSLLTVCAKWIEMQREK